MPLTPDEQAEFDALHSEFGAPPEETGVTGQFLRPIGRALLGIPNQLYRQAARFGGTLTGAPDALTNAAVEEIRSSPGLHEAVDAPQAPRGIAQTAANVGGNIVGEVGKMLLLRRLLPEGGLATNVAADAAVGGTLDEEHPGKGAAEFGAVGGIASLIPRRTIPRALMRIAGQAAVPAAVDAATGDLSEDTTKRAAAFGLFGAAGEAIPAVAKVLADRKLLRRSGPQYPEPIGPDVPVEPKPDLNYPDLAPPMRGAEPQPVRETQAVRGPDEHNEELFGPLRESGAAPAARSTAANTEPVQAGAPQPARLVTETREQRLRSQGAQPVALNPADESALFQAPPSGVGNDAFPDVVEMARRRREAEREMGVKYKGRHEVRNLLDYEDLQTGTNFNPKSMYPERVRQRALLKREQFKEPMLTQEEADALFGAPPTETGKLDELMSLLGPKTPAESPKPSKRLLSLQKSRDDVQADYDAARAIGDADAAEAARRSMEVIEAQIAKEGGQPGRMKLRRKTEEAAASGPVVSALGRGTAGALVGGALPADTDEERYRNMAIGAGLGAGLPLLKRMVAPSRTALRRQAEEMRTPGGGRINQLAGKYLNRGNTPELRRASEREKGFGELTVAPVNRAYKAVTQEEQALVAANPRFTDALNEFHTSGPSLDTTALKAAGIPEPTIELAMRAKQAKIAQQQEIAKAQAESIPAGIAPGDWDALPPSIKRAIITRDTTGKYQARVYGIDLDPKAWTKDQKAFDETVKWLKERNPTTSDDIVAQQLDEYLTKRYNGESTGFGAGNRISESLYLHRKDLSDREWQMLGDLATNPDVPAPIAAILQKGASTRQLSSLEQKLIALLSQNGNLTQADRTFARKVGERTILPESFRTLLGEVKDPLQRELLTVAKLSRSAGASRFINEISDYTRENGLKAAITTAEYEAAKAAGKDVGEYVHLKREDQAGLPSLGKLADKWVTPDVYRRLKDPASFGSPTTLFGKAAQMGVSASKQAMTVLNPATHGRQILQTPLLMIAGRVTPQGVGRVVDVIASRLKNPDDPLWRQIIEDHVLAANFSKQELPQKAIQFLKPNTAKRRLGRALMTPIQMARKLYGAPDDVVRLTTYLSALERFKGDRNKAVDFLNRYTPNYGLVSGAVQYARSNPLVGAFTNPFLSWTTEMLRIGRNLADDFLNGKSYKDRVWAAAGLASLFGVGTGLSAAGKKLLSKSEREEFEKSEKLMRTYQRYQSKIPTGRNKAGGMDFINTASVTPGGDLISLAQSLMAGDIPAAFSYNPLAGLHRNPIMSSVIDVAQGEHHFTGDKLETGGEKAKRIAEAFAPPLSPLGYEGRKIRKLLARGGKYTDSRSGQIDDTGRAILRNAGINLQSASLPVLLRNAQYETQAKIQEAQKDYRREVSSGVPQQEAQRTLLRRRQQIQEEYRALIGAAP